MVTCPDHATIQMMAHVVILPGRERAIERRVDPGMTLAAGNPRSEVISGADRSDTQGRTVDAGLERFVTTVTEDRQHICLIQSECKCHASI